MTSDTNIEEDKSGDKIYKMCLEYFKLECIIKATICFLQTPLLTQRKLAISKKDIKIKNKSNEYTLNFLNAIGYSKNVGWFPLYNNQSE